MLKINTPFLKYFLYVKLVSAHSGYLLELPDVKLPSYQNEDLEKMIVNVPSDTEYHLGKNVSQYSYTGI